jgi:cholesterol oxidase
MEIPLDNQSAGVPPRGVSQAGNLDRLSLEFREAMAGFLAVGETDPQKGAERGRSDNTPLRFDVEIRIDDLGRFLRVMEHSADLTGTITFAPLGGTFAIRDGRFNLFTVDPQTGVRQMTYAFRFTASEGQTYYLQGQKKIHDDPSMFTPLKDMTTLFTIVYRGEDEHALVYGAGELYFPLVEARSLISSMKEGGTTSWWQKTAALMAFVSFAYGALRDEYLKPVRLFYDTRYENLVLTGSLRTSGGIEAPFFFISGVHERGFPWGDTGIFWDVLLAVGDGKRGYERYCITNLVLEGLELDVSRGTYRYRGPLFKLAEGYSTSYSQMRKKEPPLSEFEADFRLEFDAQPYDAVAVSFPLVPKLVRKLSSTMANELVEHLPGEDPLGIYITPHTVRVRSGSLKLRETAGNGTSGEIEWNVVTTGSFGEAELGTFRNLREPKTLYGYLCAIRAHDQAARVQIHSRTLRDEKEHYMKDRLEAFLGAVVARTSSSEMLMEKGKLTVRPLAPAGLPSQRAPLLEKLGEPVIEVNNDQFPTGIFQRRIVEVLDPSGLRCLALEEDMSLMRLEAIGSEKKVTVASIRGNDKFHALDRVLDMTQFDTLVENKQATSGKPPDKFQIAIKPNFMFAYDKRDHTTYTDPELVHHLVKRLRGRGFANIKVVEAQSTYGEFFDQRRVKEVADYLGYDGSAGYEVVDMTLDADEMLYLGPHLGMHPVSRVWRESDFRISFAKNKTHAYAYYTLTLKNIYGALPLANKFKEYHCDKGIYDTTIEYLTAFRVDFGLVDGYLSADGPFGVFADPLPNQTHTILGGPDLVAVDWVAASKMGINPMIGKHMRLAVTAFGKPEIRVIGDVNPYRPWLNVPAALTLFTNKGVDADYHFGNLMYSAAAQMDETHFHYKNKALYIRILRKLTVPLRRTFFVRTGENPSLGNRFFSWLFYQMGF